MIFPKNKKGEIFFDFVDGIIEIVVFVAITMITLLLIYKFSTGISTMSSVPEVGKTAIVHGSNVLQTVFNWSALVLYIALIIGSVMYIRTSEADWTGILWGVLLIGFVGVLLVLPSNVYEYVSASSPDFTVILANMPIWNYILSNSLLFGLGFFLVTGIALVTKDNESPKFG